ncbi:MAG: MFS transporter [Capsulimonas sp.]|uniref:MFS transporter n=1 Tax=Capsulimonas sp. TaxID=2494211 RepID=UPI003264BE93
MNSAPTPPSDDLQPYAPQSRSWFLTILPVCLIALCAELATAILNNSTLPVYFHNGLKIGTDVLTLIMIPFFISEALFKSPLGVLADRFGRKPLMLAGALVTVFTPLILMSIHYDPAATTAVAMVICFGFLRLLDGLGGAALWPSLFAYVGDTVPENKRGAAMGLLNVTYMVGLALSFLIGGVVDDAFGPIFTGDATLSQTMRTVGNTIKDGFGHLRHHDHTPVVDAVTQVAAQPEHYFPSFYLASVLFAIAAILCATGLRSKAQIRAAAQIEHHEEEHVTWAGFLEAMRSVPQFLAIAFVTFAGIGCIATLVKIFAMEEFKVTEKEVGLLALWPILIIGALALPIGHLSDHWGKTRCVRLGFVVCAVGLWGMPISFHMHSAREIGFIGSAAVMGLGFVLAFPAWNALLTTLADADKRGTVIGAVATAQGVGVLLGVTTGGLLYKHAGHIAPFVAAASLVTIGMLLALFTIRESQLKARAR